MANPNEFTVEGTIKEIRFSYTRKGKKFGLVRIDGPKASIWVTVFSPTQVKKLLTARKGDTVKATGCGYHTGGSYRERGSTSLTARLFRVTKNEDARAKASAPQPHQLHLAV